MSNLIESPGFCFDKLAAVLTINAECRLMMPEHLKVAAYFLRYLKDNQVSSLTVDFQKCIACDSNTRVMLYRLAQYFGKDQRKSLIIVSRDDAWVQRRVVAALARLNPFLKVDFV